MRLQLDIDFKLPLCKGLSKAQEGNMWETMDIASSLYQHFTELHILYQLQRGSEKKDTLTDVSSSDTTLAQHRLNVDST